MPEHIAHTDLPGIAFAPLRQFTLAEAQAHDLTVAQDDAKGLAVQTYYGRITIVPLGEGCRAEIISERADFLQTLKDSIVGQIGEVFPEVAQGLRWSDAEVEEGSLPVNAKVMTLQSVEHMPCGFYRVTLAGDVSRFSNGAIHFRLALPPADLAVPVWPRLGPNGATVWPKGDEALHLPVYTARYVDPQAGKLVFDLLQHDGGRASEWATTTQMGSDVLVVGPGGGGCELAGPILGFSDDTAFPAIARVLEANPALTGHIRMYPRNEAAGSYPMPEHAGVKIEICPPQSGAQMAQDACAALAKTPEAYLWFAGERAQADHVRSANKAAGRTGKDAYVSAYWRREMAQA